MRHLLANLAIRWTNLNQEAELHHRHIDTITRALAPELCAAFGVGPHCAAELLITAGDNSHRIHSEAAFAKLCGVSPIPAGSGKTNGRHRLNRGGDRQANSALYRTVLVRMRWHETTQKYVARRTAQGLTKRDIIRCLKRYVAREPYHVITTPKECGHPSEHHSNGSRPTTPARPPPSSNVPCDE